jgi:hypothetical protein
VSTFEDGDLVATRTGPGLGDDRVIGRIIGYHNPLGSANAPGFYMVLLMEKVDGWPWSSLLLSEAVLEKLNILDEMSQDIPRSCPWCGEAEE